ncbi:MAG: UvrD-helicase domain-containing protein, partial [Clostridia bacterium]|nr:UvrD-helicase domain-containing protein [Clostridia bacterium]
MSNCWTEEQLKAIESRKNVLVSASAGSGKTSVMIERMAQIILNQEADISQILATTFTTLAASQMKEKLAKRLKEELPNKPELKKQLDELAYANVSTIHSFCGNLIKNYFYRLDIDASYKILEGVNETDLKLVAINNLFSHLYETSNPDFLALVEKYQTNRKDDNLQEAVLSIYKYVISEADPKAFLENALTLYTQDGLNKIENLVLLEQAEDLSLVKSVLLNLRQQGITYERITSHIDTLLEFISEVENK